jgi:ankyrin repeat protein
MYVCASPLARLSARHAASLVACAERLLDAGADPNVESADDDGDPASSTTAFARAILSGNVHLSVVLRKRGGPDPAAALSQWLADHVSPDAAMLQRTFGQYFRRPDVREAIQAQIAAQQAEGAGAPDLAFAVADPLERQQLRMPNLIGAKTDLWAAMLDRGYDPTAISSGGRSMLHGVVEYAPPAFLEVLLSRGIDFNARAANGRSVIATAVRAGNGAAADVLLAHGAEDDATPIDRLLGACLAGDIEAAHRQAARHAGLVAALTREDGEVFVRAAGRGHADQVRLFLDVGLSPDLRGESGAAPLHQAAWRGQEAVVDLLLERGASRDIRDDLYGHTPGEWAIHGSIHAQGARDRCLRIAERLRAIR